jgi:orotate phosphoribosyltransferase
MWSPLSDLALKILDIGAFKDARESEGGHGFKLKLHEKNPTAPLSPFFLNLRTPENPKPGPLTPEIVGDIGRMLFELSERDGLTYDWICGLPNAGDPLADAFVAGSGNVCPPDKLIRLGKTEGPEGRRITGLLHGNVGEGKRGLILDDVVTGGDSKREAVDYLDRVHGALVTDCLVVVDRRPFRERKASIDGLRIHALFTIEQLLEIYGNQGRIPPAMVGMIYSYLRVA